MTRDQREAYQEMQAKNELLAKDIDEKQTRLESLTQATDALQRELDSNPVKREAGVLFAAQQGRRLLHAEADGLNKKSRL